MNVEIKQIAKIGGGQDGAIFGDKLFRFDTRGGCSVYDLTGLDFSGDEVRELSPEASFSLDKSDIIAPHSNSVAFGCEYYDEGDEYPLLYTNIYNNYKNCEDELVGVCCVYRIVKDGESYCSTLVQLIEIGFTDERGLWRSTGDVLDKRPFGNFVIDRESGKYYAFVMRDGDGVTSYFTFELPRLPEGVPDEKYGVPRVVLGKEDLLNSFDAPYHNFIQGAAAVGDRVYSVEGFHEGIHPALRVIDVKDERELLHFDFFEAGYIHEAELVDFYHGHLIYSDNKGNLFLLRLSE